MRSTRQLARDTVDGKFLSQMPYGVLQLAQGVLDAEARAEKLADALQEKESEVEQLNELLDSRCLRTSTPSIVCLCGSTRFMDAFHAAGWQFTLNGEIVLSVGVCKHAEHHGGEALGQEVADALDELHLRKIDLADRVFVLNVGGYIGDSTRKEIEYAKSKGKLIGYLEDAALAADEKG